MTGDTCAGCHEPLTDAVLGGDGHNYCSRDCRDTHDSWAARGRAAATNGGIPL